MLMYSEILVLRLFKDVRGWQFLTVEAAETLCMAYVPLEEHNFRKKYLGNRPVKSNIL